VWLASNFVTRPAADAALPARRRAECLASTPGKHTGDGEVMARRYDLRRYRADGSLRPKVGQSSTGWPSQSPGTAVGLLADCFVPSATSRPPAGRGSGRGRERGRPTERPVDRSRPSGASHPHACGPAFAKTMRARIVSADLGPLPATAAVSPRARSSSRFDWSTEPLSRLQVDQFPQTMRASFWRIGAP
jgi:hypothetical protein